MNQIQKEFFEREYKKRWGFSAKTLDDFMSQIQEEIDK